MPILCALILLADLATAHGSFRVNGWNVWNNATISSHAAVETAAVPVRITLSSHQNLWIGTRSSIQVSGQTIQVIKGCAILDSQGPYRFQAKSVAGLAAASDSVELRRTAGILREYETLRQLRPTSQRP